LRYDKSQAQAEQTSGQAT